MAESAFVNTAAAAAINAIPLLINYPFQNMFVQLNDSDDGATPGWGVTRAMDIASQLVERDPQSVSAKWRFSDGGDYARIEITSTKCPDVQYIIYGDDRVFGEYDRPDPDTIIELVDTEGKPVTVLSDIVPQSNFVDGHYEQILKISGNKGGYGEPRVVVSFADIVPNCETGGGQRAEGRVIREALKNTR